MDGPDRDELPSAEAARIRRRERERSAKERELMRTGQAKAFKQILDAQANRAAALERRLAETAGGEPASSQRSSSESRSPGEAAAEPGARAPATSRRNVREARGDRRLRRD